MPVASFVAGDGVNKFPLVVFGVEVDVDLADLGQELPRAEPVLLGVLDLELPALGAFGKETQTSEHWRSWVQPEGKGENRARVAEGVQVEATTLRRTFVR